MERPNELVHLNLRSFGQQVPNQSHPNYVDFRDRNDVLSSLIGYRIAPIGFSSAGGNNSRIWAYEVTGNYFDVLGVGAQRGRVLHPDDDRTRGGHPVGVWSHNFWQRRLAGDPDVVGKAVKLNGLAYSVVGVAPAGFFGTEMPLPSR